jgi:hypothetical protein
MAETTTKRKFRYSEDKENDFQHVSMSLSKWDGEVQAKRPCHESTNARPKTGPNMWKT